MKSPVVDIQDFSKYGFVAREDTTLTKPGALRIMRNAVVTDRNGLAPRPGMTIVGEFNANASDNRGLYVFRKSLGTDEIVLKAYSDRLEFLSKNYQSAGWQLLKSGYTANKEFGFATSLVNTENQDYIVGSNRYDPYFRWTGEISALNGALAGGEAAVTVDSTLQPDVFESKIATANSATTLDVAGTPWAASQWIGFYVLITSGALVGKVRLISANTSSQVTFATLGAAPGNVTFEIRRLKYPASGTIIYNGTTIAYSAIDLETTFTVLSAHAAADGTPVTLVPTEYPANPRGNRFTNYLGRIIVGNVRSAMARNAGGALAGFASAGSAFVSKLLNPFDFTYSATRVAGEGDIIAMPYGGGDITDVQYQEDTAYVLKANYIEAIKYSQDANDLAVRDPLKAGVGSIGKTLKGSDDIYFFTADKQLTSIGRVKLVDVRVKTLNIGDQIKRFLEACGMDDVGRGIEIGQRLYFPLKSAPNIDANDILLVYNRDQKIFEGIWNVGAFGLEKWNSEYLLASSNGANVYQLFQGHSDVLMDESFAIDMEIASHWMNLTASKANTQAQGGVVIEGYVAPGAAFTSNFWKSFEEDPFLTFNFSFTEEGFLDGELTSAFLGGEPLALDPMAVDMGPVDDDGRRHFSFFVYHPFQYANYFSFGFANSAVDSDFEITRVGLMMKEDPARDANRIKTV